MRTQPELHLAQGRHLCDEFVGFEGNIESLGRNLNPGSRRTGGRFHARGAESPTDALFTWTVPKLA